MYSPNFEITPHILQALLEIEHLKSQIERSVILPTHEVELRYRATVESIHSSTSIEGNPLNLKQVEATLSDNSPRLSRSQVAKLEVKNYQSALAYITKRKTTKRPITKTDIFKIHHLISRDLLDSSRSGNFRHNMVYVEDRDGEIVYTAAKVDQVQPEIHSLLQWLSASNDVHPLIKAAIFHIQFVSIHPFSDGNGRTTRALTTLYLGLTNFDFKDSLALDTYFASDRHAHYAALSSQGANYTERSSADLTNWIEYFIDGVLACAKVLAAEIAILSKVIETPSDLTKIAQDQMDILDYVERFGEITASEADDILVGTKRTAQRKLKKLVDLGYLEVVGDGRNTKYKKSAN